MINLDGGGKLIIGRYNFEKGILMKKLILPICIFIGGLAIAHYFFGLDVNGLIEGSIDYVGDILDGPNN